MTFDELMAILRRWTGRTVTMLASPGSGQLDPDDPITGTLFEGHAPAVTAPMIDPPDYQPTEDSAQFTLSREAVPNSRWPVGITCHLNRRHTTAQWDNGREGKAVWIALAEGHTSLWVLEDE